MVSDLNICTQTGSKIATAKKNSFFFTIFYFYLFTFEVPFKRLFAPTFQSLMTKIFRDSEFLGKSNGMKWSKIWIFLLKNGLKSPQQKSFLLIFFLLFTQFKHIFGPISWNPMSKLFWNSESLGKTNEKKWSQIFILLLMKSVKSPRKKKLIFNKFSLTSRIFLGIVATILPKAPYIEVCYHNLSRLW